MTWLASGAAVLLLSSCSQQTKVCIVDEQVADQALLAKIIGECRNNPGELHDGPNCRNAKAADGKLRLERMRKSLGG